MQAVARLAGRPTFSLARRIAALDRGVGSVRQASSKHSASSSRWLARQKKDPFVRARKQDVQGQQGQPFVSRAAYKLLQLDEKHRFLRRDAVVVDLGAAPGGWTQVALRAGCAHVFALDLLPLDPALQQEPNAAGRLSFLQGDFRDDTIQSRIAEVIRDRGSPVAGDVEARPSSPSVNVVISDMMANMSGNRDRDISNLSELLCAAIDFAEKALLASAERSKDTVLIMKYFDSEEAQEIRNTRLLPAFDKVYTRKVSASRSESSEMYFVCTNIKTTASS